MGEKYVYINTIGCQMNVYDSQQMAFALEPLGYEKASSPESADLIIVNTCSIRKKAEEKAFSFLGRLVALKRKKPNLLIGVGGCVAQQEGKNILRRMPFIDIVFGTRAIGRLPQLIRQVESTGSRIVDVEMTDQFDEYGFTQNTHNTVSSFVTIMRGCDNYCTYCVVPHVRGRETSRAPNDIIEEIQKLAEQGVREVTLLGQNVNSYGKKENLCSFTDLLKKVDEIKGLTRIRFTTSHPKDFSNDLIYAYGDLEKLCEHIHLPIQSGSNRILKKMNRGYTREHYLEKIDTLRHVLPEISVTSDIIVGFPGETEAEFYKTLDLIKAVEFDGLFAFIYSDRPDTRASGYANKLADQEKKVRLQALLKIQEGITRKKNQALLGKIQSVLIEGTSKKQCQTVPENHQPEIQWTGRTSTNKIVHFTDMNSHNREHAGFNSTNVNPVKTGEIVDVRIEKAFSHSLFGKQVRVEPSSNGQKGDETYAA